MRHLSQRIPLSIHPFSFVTSVKAGFQSPITPLFMPRGDDDVEGSANNQTALTDTLTAYYCI